MQRASGTCQVAVLNSIGCLIRLHFHSPGSWSLHVGASAESTHRGVNGVIPMAPPMVLIKSPSSVVDTGLPVNIHPQTLKAAVYRT